MPKSHPLDPELAVALDTMRPMLRSVGPGDIAAMRQGAAWLAPTDETLARGGSITVARHAIDRDGGSLDILLLRPAAATTTRPPLLFLHGGGTIAGDARTGIEAVLDWVTDLGIAVASVTYRLAPEHPHPAALEDCHAALGWLDREREALGLDAGPILLAGASAGGGLAAGLTLLAIERGGPAIGDLVLMAPMLDDTARFPSSVAFDGDAPWDARSNRTGWAALLGEQIDGEVPAVAAPSRAASLAGFPPTYCDVGAVETFRDETIDFAGRLAQAGVATELHVWAGAFHGFDVLAPTSAVARAARTTRRDYLARRLRARGAA